MLWRLSQNSALVPKKWARRKAVSPVMARRPLIISVMRLVGTLSWRARAAALILSAFSSSAKCSPGWIAINVIGYSPLVIINDLDVGRARRLLRPLKANPPLIVDADAVLTFAISSQRFKTVARQGGQILQRDGRLQTV